MRHVYTGAGVFAAAIGGMSLMSPDTVSKILAAVHQIGDGIVSIATGVGVLIPIASGAYAAWTASHQSKLVSIADDPQTAPQVKQVVTAQLAATAAATGTKT
jgi:hypothetical protein